MREQQQLLTQLLQRPSIDITGAYIDQLVLNLYDGPGLIDTFVDDMEIGPVFQVPESVAETAPPRAVGTPARPAMARRTGEVQLKGNQLYVSGKHS